MKKIFLTSLLMLMNLTGCNRTVSAQESTVENTSETSGSENNTEENEIELAPLSEVEAPKLRRTDGSNGERQVYLAEGSVAPFAGVLINPEGMAFIIAEVEALQLRAASALRLQRESDWNRLQLETGRLRLRINFLIRQHQIIVEGLQRENQRLIRIHEQYIEEQKGQFWNTTFGKVIKYTLIVISAGAVGAVIGYLGAI